MSSTMHIFYSDIVVSNICDYNENLKNDVYQYSLFIVSFHHLPLSASHFQRLFEINKVNLYQGDEKVFEIAWNPR